MKGEWQNTIYGKIAPDFVEDRLAVLCDPNAGIQTGPFGSQLHQEDYVPVGVGTPILTVEHLGENRILHENVPCVSEKDKTRLSKYMLREGDIVFSRVGSVDRRALVRADEDGWLFSGRCLRVRPDRAKIDPCYLSYFFGLPSFKEHIRAIAVGATMPSLNTQILSDVIVPYPLDIVEQRAIAHILGTLDDKIELNRRMNETLEAMARALFKSWFIDFDPVRAKTEGRDPGLPKEIANLFPDEFEDSELGEIPKGWQVMVLNNLVSVIIGGDWGVDEPTSENFVAARCIRGADIPDLQNGGIGKMPIRYLKPSSLEKRMLRDGDLIVEISGGSPTQSTGRPVFISEWLCRRLEVPIVCSNFCRLVKPIKPTFSKFLYLWLRSLYTNDEFLQFENGTTGIKNLAFTLFSATYKLCVPTEGILSEFETHVKPVFARQQASASENDSLALFRNTLLPKLLSGEIRVKEVNRSIGRYV